MILPNLGNCNFITIVVGRMNKMTPNEESHHLLSDEHCPNSSFSERGVLGNRDEHALSLASSPAKFSLDVVYTTHKQMNEITVFVTVNH